MANKPAEPVVIQTVYCATGEACVRTCLSLNLKDNKLHITGQLIEVPNDETIYRDTISIFQKLLDKKLIPSNVTHAKQVIQKGHYTFQQAKRIAESNKCAMIKIIRIKGSEAIVCTLPIGLSAAITTYLHLIQGKTEMEAIQHGLYTMIAIGEERMLVYLLEKSFDKPALQEITKQLLIKGGLQLDGLSSTSSLSEILRGKKLTLQSIVRKGVIQVASLGLNRGTLFGIKTAIDLIQMSNDKRSKQQVTKNALDNAAGVTGGVTGSAIGAVVGNMILPVGGGLIGGAIGGFIGGTATNKVSSVVTGKFIKTDKQIFEKFIKELVEPQLYQLADEFLLVENECDELKEQLGLQLVKKKTGISMQKLRDYFSSKNNQFIQIDAAKQCAFDLLLPYFNQIVSARKSAEYSIFSQLI